MSKSSDHDGHARPRAPRAERRGGYPAKITILYFAWLRDRLGRGEEPLTLPPDVNDVDGVMAMLAGRGGEYAKALADPRGVRAAVNQDYADGGHPVGPGDEVALFPPVTGG